MDLVVAQRDVVLEDGVPEAEAARFVTSEQRAAREVHTWLVRTHEPLPLPTESRIVIIHFSTTQEVRGT